MSRQPLQRHEISKVQWNGTVQRIVVHHQVLQIGQLLQSAGYGSRQGIVLPPHHSPSNYSQRDHRPQCGTTSFAAGWSRTESNNRSKDVALPREAGTVPDRLLLFK